jgi:hypothetical protein
LEKSVRLGMPRTICTTHIVETGGDAVGERVVPPGLCQDSYIVVWDRGWSVTAGQLWHLFFPMYPSE